MSLEAEYNEYSERREKIIRAGRWFSQSFEKDSVKAAIRGRLLRMQRLSKGRGIQFLLFSHDTNVSLFLSAENGCYSDFTSLVRVGDLIVSEYSEDGKGLSVVDFSVAAVCAINPEDLNFFNHNAGNYKGDALHKRVCGSRSEIDSYKTMSTVLESLHAAMRKESFLQVLTPTLERQYRGGYARPFVSHSNHFREDIFFRVSAEIHHKQLIIGGLERLYEIVLSFRNESASSGARNGFNLVEVEAAFSDESLMFSVLRSFLSLACEKLGIEVPQPGPAQSAEQLLYESTGKSVGQIKELRTKAPYSALGDDAFSLNNYRLANLILRRFVIPSCKGLSIVQDLKDNYSPFVMKTENEVFRWFVIWNGYKIAEVYRSETDAALIRKGMEDICRNTGRSLSAYENYLHSQCSGMPPIATMSIGIERIIMVLCGKDDLHKVFE